MRRVMRLKHMPENVILRLASFSGPTLTERDHKMERHLDLGGAEHTGISVTLSIENALRLLQLTDSPPAATIDQVIKNAFIKLENMKSEKCPHCRKTFKRPK